MNRWWSLCLSETYEAGRGVFPVLTHLQRAPSIRVFVYVKLSPDKIMIAHVCRPIFHDAPPSREVLDRGGRQDDPVLSAPMPSNR
jgi:hypothetical protein